MLAKETMRKTDFVIERKNSLQLPQLLQHPTPLCRWTRRIPVKRLVLVKILEAYTKTLIEGGSIEYSTWELKSGY